MCFYSDPLELADLLEETAKIIRDYVKKDEEANVDDLKRVGAFLEKIDFELKGCMSTRANIDLEALQGAFL